MAYEYLGRGLTVALMALFFGGSALLSAGSGAPVVVPWIIVAAGALTVAVRLAGYHGWLPSAGHSADSLRQAVMQNGTELPLQSLRDAKG